jgi:hypothetical protein
MPLARPRTPAMLPIVAAFAVTAMAASWPGTTYGQDNLQFRGSLTWTNAGVYSKPTTNPANPDNVLQVPEQSLVSQFKPDLKIYNSKLSLIARPRVKMEVTRVKDAAEDEYKDSKGRSESELLEGFGQWNVSDNATFAYGLHSYQWGPAESFSPSNRIFHETVSARNILFDVRGKHMARINLTYGRHLSLVVMTEFEENENEAPFIAEEEFDSATLAKGEVSWNSGADYLGIVLGGREHGRPWVGEYFSIGVGFIEGLSLYADVSHQRGSDAWYPVERLEALPPTGNVPVVRLERSEMESEELYTIAAGGMRYDFEGGTTLRIEYISNAPGYDEEQNAMLQRALAPQLHPEQQVAYEQTMSRLNALGLDFLGQKLVFASIMAPDFLDIKDLTVYLRGMQSVTDDSVNGYGSIEYAATDNGTLFLASSGASGEPTDELMSLSSPTHTLGYRHVW